jgi:isoleucyl-tRNA synthetase
MTDKKTDKKNYKNTLNLPNTSFDMRAGLLKKEPAVQQRWKNQNLYKQIRAAREGAERFILHDGPPYANGNIHMGTAMNKVLKDIIIRIKTMSNMDAPYIPGWDCHGLPIEAKVMSELGNKARSMAPGEIRRHCAAYAEKFVELQSRQFQRMGIMGEFDKPYITMDRHYEAAALEVFAHLVAQGLVYRQLKPVHWSIENRTALADAELEYHDRQDSSVYVAFEVVKGAEHLSHEDGEKMALLVWTTTPWTLPANRAVAIHPGFNYVCLHVETADGPATWVIAEERLEAVLADIEAKRKGWLKSHQVVTHIRGADLTGGAEPLGYAHPLTDGLICPVVTAEYVTLEDGTGLVHTAPGHGLEDYGTALKNDLEIYCPVQADGTFDDTAAPWLRGVVVWDANARVVDHLRQRRTLVLAETITHSYPHDWRSKTPTIFRATKQWFIAVDVPLADGERSLRDLAMEACRRGACDGGVDFIPAWGRKRIAGMLEGRPDWCISRQRSWGLPIPAFYNKSGQAMLTPTSVRAVAKTVEENGSEAWFTLDPVDLLAGYDPVDDPDLPNGDRFPLDQLTAGSDILDVWFESGSSWFAAAIARGLVEDIPVNMYLEGSDQHRGWFQLSLLPALGARARPPFAAVLTHGFVVTEDGHKMSKSLGNAIDVIEQLDKRGADILRLWVASQNYQDDIRCSDSLIAQAEDAYRKIRNTLRFCMGACCDFDLAADAVEPAGHSIDLWMRMQLHQLIRNVRAACDRYEFHRAMRLMHEFCTVQASSVYLSAAKDRLYCELPTAQRRRATQSVIHEMLVALIKLLAPILPHTCEEAWDHIPHRNASEPHSVHLATLPECDRAMVELAENLTPVAADLAAYSPDELQPGPAWIWARLMDLRQAGLVKLEALRNAGVKNPLDVEAVFKVAHDNDQVVGLIETYLKELEDLLGVGYARLERSGDLAEGEIVEVEVHDTRGKYRRCARSWKRRPDVGSDKDYPDLCARDAGVMRQIAGHQP